MEPIETLLDLPMLECTKITCMLAVDKFGISQKLQIKNTVATVEGFILNLTFYRLS